MIFRWGHFADLHLQYPDYDNAAIRRDLNTKLQKICSKKPLHAIFVAGDMFNKGSIMRNDGSEEADYTVIDAVVEQLHNMAASCQCEIKNLIVVPGNHDLPRTIERQETLTRIIEKYQRVEPPSKPKFIPTRTEQGAIYDVPCTPFQQFCQKLYTGTDRKVQFPHDFFELRYDGIHWANVITLNTATFDAFSRTESEKKFKSNTPYFCIDETKLDNLEERCKAGNFEHTIDFVLAHHSIEYIAPREADKLQRFMETIGIDLYLCGHIHRQGFYTFNSRHDIRQISCGGIFSDNREDYNEPCFYIGEYDNVTQEITIYAYSYSTAAKAWVAATSFPSPWEEGKFSRKLLRLPSLTLRKRIQKEFLSGDTPDLSSYSFPKTVRDFLHRENRDGLAKELFEMLSADIDLGKKAFRDASTKQFDFVVYYCIALLQKHRERVFEGDYSLKNLVETYADYFEDFLLSWETRAWLARRNKDYEQAFKYDCKMISMLEDMGYKEKEDQIKHNAGVFVSRASTIVYALDDTSENANPWLTDVTQQLESALKAMSLIAECWRDTYKTDSGYPKHYSIWIMLLVHKCLRTESPVDRGKILVEINDRIKESHSAENPHPLD